MRHRRLKQILQGNEEWYEFDGTLVARKIWNGRGPVDEFRGDSPAGPVDGMSLRLYDHTAGQWRDYYTSAAKRIFDPPLIGRFQGTRAEFYGQELFEGNGILIRQIWSNLTASSCRWEQAFSADFDFLIGEWSVLHRRLKRRLVADTEWVEFSGSASVRKILSGFGNFDELLILSLPETSYLLP